MDFQPEIGQGIFSTTPWQRYKMQDDVEAALSAIGVMLESSGKCNGNPTSNSGVIFECDVFKMRAYCWCDGTVHTNECPPNFEWRDFVAGWYKHVGRSNSQNRPMDANEIVQMLAECAAAIAKAK